MSALSARSTPLGATPLMALGLVTGPALVAAGCDEQDQLMAVVPELLVSPAELDFEGVPLGATKRLTLELRNGGVATLEVEDLMVSEPFFFEVAEGLPQTLAPGEQRLVDVGFRPTTVDPVAQTLLLQSNDPARSPLPVRLAGFGTDGLLSVTPEAIDFSNTPVGGARLAEVVLENQGLADVSGRVVLEGTSRPGFFVSGGGPVEGEFSVVARGTVPLDLEYRPLEPGEHGAVLRFETCPGRCGVEVRVVASAQAPTIRLEPAVIAFGDVGIGTRRAEQLTVRNEGSAATEVLEVRARGGSDALELSPTRSLPATLQPGDVLAIDVAFQPREALELNATVEVLLDDPAFPQAEAGVSGRGVGPLFVVQPLRLNFGVVTTQNESRRTVLGLNAGSAQVQVNSVSVRGDPAFSLGNLPGLPLSLGSGETLPVSVLFSPPRLGSFSATVTFSSSDPQSPALQVPVVAGYAERTCELEVDPPTVNFGAVVPGFVRARRVRVINRGSEHCILQSGAFRAPVDASLTLLGPDPFPFVLTPTAELALDFEYRPIAEQEMKSIFTVRTDEPVFPIRNLSFVGTGAGYVDLFARPRVIDFGQSRPDCPPEEATLEVVNAGSGPVTVAALTLTSSTTAQGELGLVNPPNPPFPINPGTAAAINVRYDAVDLGPETGSLEIGIQDLPFPLIVPILGEGSPNPAVLDQFVQRPRNNVDVLFVIDDSCSMVDEQQAIAANFRSFIQQANLRQVDFRIGITTTTVLGTAGRLVGSPITPQTRNIEQAFATQTSVGILGSGIEKGLEATVGAVVRGERGLLPNADLFRAGVPKVFIIVSDEDDSSSATPLFYATALTQRFTDPVAAVVSGERIGCISADGSATPASRYLEFLARMNGISASICGNWSQTLRSIGQAAFGLQVRFDLTRPPEPSRPIDVRVDGQLLPANRFSLDPSGPTVIIQPPPAEGARIDIQYVPSCGN